MQEKNEKLEMILNSLKERNLTIEDLKANGEEFPEDDEEIEVLNGVDLSDGIDDSQTISQSTKLREDDTKDVDLDGFF